MTQTYPLRFENNFHHTIWGGHRLELLKGMPQGTTPVGESWEVSGLAASPSVVRNGPLAGLTLDEVIRHWGPALLGQHIFRRYRGQCPLLVKFIDAASDLSVQVHPDDALAARRHGASGKTEMWYVIDAEPGASLLLGLRDPLTQDDYTRRVADGTIIDALARHAVQRGDVFYIPAGRIHSICGGIMVCEIQQSSDITYRLWDYGRLGLDGRPRQLHTELAREAIDFTVHNDYRTPYDRTAAVAMLIDSPYFVTTLLNVDTSVERQLESADSCVTLTCLEGSARATTAAGHTVELPKGSSCLIPAIDAHFTVEGHAKLLEAWAK